MADRPLTAGEKALWQKVIETVEPIDNSRVQRVRALPVLKKFRHLSPSDTAGAITAETFGGVSHKAVPLKDQIAVPEKHGLDGRWDKRITKGALSPDVTVDLHGYTLTAAHSRLDHALELSIAAGHRAILLITGKARTEEERYREGGRGAIRAAISDWLAASRHASHIATVRRAHPRHGGAGALYIILRRKR